jgi:hypothetical protein
MNMIGMEPTPPVSVRKALFGDHDPYNGVPEGTVNTFGWGDHTEAFAKVVADAGPVTTILEIGSWLGASAIRWARLAPDAEVVCLDTWLGSSEMWLAKNDVHRDLKFRNGRPSIYENFLTNIVTLGLTDQVTPFPVASSVGLDVLKELNVRPTIVYVDASHSFSDCFADIMGALELDPGIVCGDDFSDNWVGVKEAVYEAFGTSGVTIDDRGFWRTV